MALNLTKTKLEYITIVGSDVKRFGENRKLNLTKFLPSMFQETETQQFTQFFEDFLNTLFEGYDGMTVSASDISVSGDYSLSGVSGVLVPYEYQNPMNTSTVSATTNTVENMKLNAPADLSKRISVIEKVYRLTELKDPDLIDIEYIQYFASNMGYNIDVYRPEVGNVGVSLGYRGAANPTTSASDIASYLRFMVSNLPNWYKIKTTDNAVKVMLYSFGMIGDIIKYYTDTYLPQDEGGKWKADYDGDLSTIPTNYFCTPHFAVRVYVDTSDDLITEASKRSSVIRAIESVQPINSVFRNLSGYALRYMNVNAQMLTRFTRYIRITG